ncbi:MAG: TIGR03936 family radical SAM-associated protein [Planctomycetota bacterium]
MALEFRISGILRFLSHREMVSVFQRSLARLGIRVSYGGGFNPHPKLSLPLPRSVSIESEGDIVWFECEDTLDADEFARLISAELPRGCEITKVSTGNAGKMPKAVEATYMIPIRAGMMNDKIRAAAKHLVDSDELYVDRIIDDRGRKRKVNVGRFVLSVDTAGDRVAVICRIGPEGTIRIGEILELLGINDSMLSGAVRRMAVNWESQDFFS